MVMQKKIVADAASDNIQYRWRKMEEIRWEKGAMRNSGAEQEDKITFHDQGKGKNRREMRKPSQSVRCTLLSGSAWCSHHRCAAK